MRPVSTKSKTFQTEFDKSQKSPITQKTQWISMMIIYMISPVFIASLPAQTNLLDCQTFHTFGRTWKRDNRPTAIAGDDVTNL